MGFRKQFAEVSCQIHGKHDAKRDGRHKYLKVSLDGSYKRQGCPACKKEANEAARMSARNVA